MDAELAKWHAYEGKVVHAWVMVEAGKREVGILYHISAIYNH